VSNFVQHPLNLFSLFFREAPNRDRLDHPATLDPRVRLEIPEDLANPAEMANLAREAHATIVHHHAHSPAIKPAEDFTGHSSINSWSNYHYEVFPIVINKYVLFANSSPNDHRHFLLLLLLYCYFPPLHFIHYFSPLAQLEPR
jgi:hypothetical protein